MRSTVISAILLSFAFGTGVVLAQDTPPAASDQPAVSSKTSADKKAIAKSCIDKANAKGLHGDARKKFKAACKKAAGKTE
jgi:hypothetical protein